MHFDNPKRTASMECCQM
jgi:hypothetical protein